MINFHLFGSKVRPLVGLDISSSSVKMVELSGSEKDGYRIERFSIEPLPRDAVVDGNIANLEGVGDAVKRAVRRMGAGVKQVAVALPASAVITKKIVLPEGLREQDMELQVESEANQYIPFPLDEVNLDFQVVGPSPASLDDVEVLIAASRKEKVEDRVAAAESAGLKVSIVDVESFAAEAAFELVTRQLPDEARDRIVALVDIGSTGTGVTILRNGRQLYAREQPLGGNQLTQDIARQYGMTAEEAEAAKLSGDLPEDFERDLMRPFLDSVALEISRALQFFFTSTQFNEVHHIVLAGGCAGMPGLDEVVKGRTQVETTVANPFAEMALSSKVRPKSLLAAAPSLMVACGLALRRFDT
ncbi:MAG: pilus assembly protein PilM [Rhodocyclaceae bacterium]|nr:pilus assembly protein PilM [Rhodocyclaceae bacterium]